MLSLGDVPSGTPATEGPSAVLCPAATCCPKVSSAEEEAGGKQKSQSGLSPSGQEVERLRLI